MVGQTFWLTGDLPLRLWPLRSTCGLGRPLKSTRWSWPEFEACGFLAHARRLQSIWSALAQRIPSPRHGRRAQPLATPTEIAAYLGVPVKTLYQWKYRGTGPMVHKVGRHLRYRWCEVDAWLDQQTAYDLTA